VIKRRFSMQDLKPNQSIAPENSNDASRTDAGALAGEPLAGSGFEDEIPDPGFEWRD
jgi:hypothetical protein